MVDTAEKPNKSGFKGWATWKKVASVIAVIIIVVIVIAFTATNALVKVSNEFLTDLQTGNASGGYALFSKEAAAATDKSTFKDVVDRVGPILNTSSKMTSREIKGETGQAGTGKVTYEIKGTDNVNYIITINLVKEDGQWKVVNFQSDTKK